MEPNANDYQILQQQAFSFFRSLQVWFKLLFLYLSVIPSSFVATISGTGTLYTVSSSDETYDTITSSYPAFFSTACSRVLRLLLTMVRLMGWRAIFAVLLVLVFGHFLLKKKNLQKKQTFKDERFSHVYVFNHVSNYAEPDMARSTPTPIPPSRRKWWQKTLTQVNTIYYSIRAAFTPLNSHYVFPPVDFAADPIAVLQRISPALHQPSFNSSLLQDALFEACTNQNHPVALLLLQDNMHFVDLSEFKVWFIKLLIKPHHQLRNHQLVTRWFDNQVQADLGKVFSTPIARNLEELQYHLFLWEQLHFLSGVPATKVFPLLQATVWSSHPWLCKIMEKLLQKHPKVDFQTSIFLLADYQIDVPKSFPTVQPPGSKNSPLTTAITGESSSLESGSSGSVTKLVTYDVNTTSASNVPAHRV